MRRLILTIAAYAIAVTASMAQDFQTGYFLQGYTQAYKLNPAKTPEKAFISLPGLGGVSVFSRGNIGLDNIIFPVSDGKLGFFTHPEVSSRQFLGGLKSTNRFTENFSTELLGFGFKKGPFYHTFDVSLRSIGGAKVPYELFKFLKDGIEDKISIPSMSLAEHAYLELAYGLSMKIGDMISVGGRVKYLMGILNANVGIDNLTITNNNGIWTVKGHTHGRCAYDGVEMKTKVDETGTRVIDRIDLNKLSGISGHGAALDMGVVLSMVPDWTFSASLCDIGGMRWRYAVNGRRDSEWVYDGDSEDLEDDLAKLLELEDVGAEKGFKMLPATLRLAAEWIKLSYVSFGILATRQFSNVPWTELRASANFKAGKVLGASVSAAVGSFGFNWGAAFNLDFKVINLHLGMDAIPTKFTPQYIPLGHCNLGASFGLTITI